jgi:hypothetical protein
MRYKAQGQYIVDTTTDLSVARATEFQTTNLLAQAERWDDANKMAVVIAAALNMYNDNQGGL